MNGVLHLRQGSAGQNRRVMQHSVLGAAEGEAAGNAYRTDCTQPANTEVEDRNQS